MLVALASLTSACGSQDFIGFPEDDTQPLPGPVLDEDPERDPEPERDEDPRDLTGMHDWRVELGWDAVHIAVDDDVVWLAGHDGDAMLVGRVANETSLSPIVIGDGAITSLAPDVLDGVIVAGRTDDGHAFAARVNGASTSWFKTIDVPLWASAYVARRGAGQVVGGASSDGTYLLGVEWIGAFSPIASWPGQSAQVWEIDGDVNGNTFMRLWDNNGIEVIAKVDWSGDLIWDKAVGVGFQQMCTTEAGGLIATRPQPFNTSLVRFGIDGSITHARELPLVAAPIASGADGVFAVARHDVDLAGPGDTSTIEGYDDFADEIPAWFIDPDAPIGAIAFDGDALYWLSDGALYKTSYTPRT